MNLQTLFTKTRPLPVCVLLEPENRLFSQYNRTDLSERMFKVNRMFIYFCYRLYRFVSWKEPDRREDLISVAFTKRPDSSHRYYGKLVFNLFTLSPLYCNNTSYRCMSKVWNLSTYNIKKHPSLSFLLYLWLSAYMKFEICFLLCDFFFFGIVNIYRI